MKFKDILTALEQNQEHPEVPWLRMFLKTLNMQD